MPLAVSDGQNLEYVRGKDVVEQKHTPHTQTGADPTQTA
jgi:hypothetical protein